MTGRLSIHLMAASGRTAMTPMQMATHWVGEIDRFEEDSVSLAVQSAV